MSLRFVLLTVLQNTDSTGYEITREFDTVLGYFWRASHQHVYRELGRMEEEGLVRFRVETQEGKPDRKVYSVTPAGTALLRSWLAEPLPPRKVNDELMVRLVAAGVLGPEGLKTIRPELAARRVEHEKRLQEYLEIEAEHYSPAALAVMPMAIRLVHLTLRRGIRIQRSTIEWLEEVDGVLSELLEGTEQGEGEGMNRTKETSEENG